MRRRIVFAVFDGAQSLDLCGPLEAFSVASRLLEHRGQAPSYRIMVAAREAGPVVTSSGLQLVAEIGLARVRKVDTLVVVGGDGAEAAAADERFIRQIRRLARGARRVASVCTGAFVLAQAGLLDGRRATTHWLSSRRLQRRHPQIDVEADRIFVRDGAVSTSAGVTAGIDLALALIEEDLGREVALATARLLVVYLKRPGGQAQYSAPLEAQGRARPSVGDLVAWIRDNLGRDLEVSALAQRAGMSRRHFVRVFTKEVGVPPSRFVARVRVEEARRCLEEGDESVEEVADRCGFGTSETMRRTFLRTVGVAPADYRRRFAG